MKLYLENRSNGGAVGPTLQKSLAGNESKIQVTINRISGIPVGRWGSGGLAVLNFYLQIIKPSDHSFVHLAPICSNSKSCYLHIPSADAVILV